MQSGDRRPGGQSVAGVDVARKEAGQRGGVSVPAGDEPAAAAAPAEEAPVWLTIGQRLAAIRAECFGIGKQDIDMETKSGAKFRIKGHTIEAVLSELRPLLARYQVDLTPQLFSRTDTGNRCDIIVDFVFECLDFPAPSPHGYMIDRGLWVRAVRWAGSGTDNSDKAFAKAGTNCLKEMLKKVFLITDRDDAKEEEDQIEHRAEGGASRDEVEQTKDRAKAAIEQWARVFKNGLEKQTTAKDLDRLVRDNRKQLDDENLSEVTRRFFDDLIAKRKKELEGA
jgi:hypothetical protein